MEAPTSIWGALAAALALGLALLLARPLLRLAVREFFRAITLLEVAALKVVRIFLRPRYELRGACQQRGACCTMIVGDPPRLIKDTPALLKAYIGFHRFAHRFETTGRGEQGEIIFRCLHLQRDGRCGIYRYRPFLCRNYPVIPFIGHPRPLPGCGYRVVHRSAAKMRQHPALPVLTQVAVHHPSPPGGSFSVEDPEDFTLVALQPPAMPSAGSEASS